MEVSTKELRVQPGKIIDQVVHGEEVTVTFRGKALARIVPISDFRSRSENSDSDIFGMWKSDSSDNSVEGVVRGLRKGRTF